MVMDLSVGVVLKYIRRRRGSVFGATLLTKNDLANDNNIELWRQINEKVAVNMKWRDE